jgi:hypothetical protein
MFQVCQIENEESLHPENHCLLVTNGFSSEYTNISLKLCEHLQYKKFRIRTVLRANQVYQGPTFLARHGGYPSYSGGGVRRVESSRPALGKGSETLSQKQNMKGLWRMWLKQ